MSEKSAHERGAQQRSAGNTKWGKRGAIRSVEWENTYGLFYCGPGGTQNLEVDADLRWR